MKSIYDYSNYKAFLNGYLASQPKKGHGLKLKWAKALNCNSAYVSQVLNQAANFSFEQTEELCELLSLSQDEGYFLQLLVQLERAGTVKLRTRLNSQIKEILTNRALLRNRVDIKERLPEMAQIKYYSSWHYAAIHMAITIKALQTKASLQQHFNLSHKKINEILGFLEKFNLIEKQNNIYITGKSRIFLGSDSDLISKHHTNWRMRAIESFDNLDDSSVHLSTVITMSKSDFLNIRESVLAHIDQVRKTVKDSTSEEELICFNVDLFKLR